MKRQLREELEPRTCADPAPFSLVQAVGGVILLIAGLLLALILAMQLTQFRNPPERWILERTAFRLCLLLIDFGLLAGATALLGRCLRALLGRLV